MISKGIRLLLANPLLTTRDDGFELVKDHHHPIAEWFEQHCGWRLHVERRYVLLVKTGVKPDPTRPARTADGTPFDRKRYTLLCLVCAELMEAPVTTTALLKDRVGNDEALDDVLEFLEQRGVLRPIGDRYRVDRTLLERLTEQSTVERSKMHQLLDDPVVYNHTLTKEQREAVEQIGFVAEERNEGVLLVDPEGLATDTRFPDDSPAKTVALTLLNRLPATKEELEAETQDLIDKHKIYRHTTASQLTEEALDVLRGFGLVKDNEPLPAAARYRT